MRTENQMLARYLRISAAVIIAISSVSTAAYASEALVDPVIEQPVSVAPEQPNDPPVATATEQPIITAPTTSPTPQTISQATLDQSLAVVAPLVSADLRVQLVSRSLSRSVITDQDLVLARTPTGARIVASKLNSITYRWSDGQLSCLTTLWLRESHWNFKSKNSRSGAYGIPQANPGSKMSSAGSDWRSNPITQLKWGMSYVNARYGNPCRALAKSKSFGWY